MCIQRFSPFAQVEMHPALRQDDLLQFCRSEQVVVTAHCPLGSGDSEFGTQVSGF